VTGLPGLNRCSSRQVCWVGRRSARGSCPEDPLARHAGDTVVHGRAGCPSPPSPSAYERRGAGGPTDHPPDLPDVRARRDGGVAGVERAPRGSAQDRGHQPSRWRAGTSLSRLDIRSVFLAGPGITPNLARPGIQDGGDDPSPPSGHGVKAARTPSRPRRPTRPFGRPRGIVAPVRVHGEVTHVFAYVDPGAIRVVISRLRRFRFRGTEFPPAGEDTTAEMRSPGLGWIDGAVLAFLGRRVRAKGHEYAPPPCHSEVQRPEFVAYPGVGRFS